MLGRKDLEAAYRTMLRMMVGCCRSAANAMKQNQASEPTALSFVFQTSSCVRVPTLFLEVIDCKGIYYLQERNVGKRVEP